MDNIIKKNSRPVKTPYSIAWLFYFFLKKQDA